MQTASCPGLCPQLICYQLFENTAKKAASFSLIMQCSSFTTTHTASLYKWQPGCAGGKAFERDGIIKELLAGQFLLLQLFLLSGFGSCVPSCIALFLPDSIFPLGFFVLLIAGHNNQLQKGAGISGDAFLFRKARALFNLQPSARGWGNKAV